MASKKIGHFKKTDFHIGSFHVEIRQSEQESHEYNLKIGSYGSSGASEMFVSMQEDDLRDLGELLIEAADKG